MLLSIVIPVYNAQKYLEESLKSVAAAKNEDIEVILVDDGSKDNSPDICDKWEKLDNRFHAFHIANGGVSNARNYGISKSKGQYIMFLDADDYLDESKWPFILEKISEDGSDFIAFAYYTLFDDGKLKAEPFWFDGDEATDAKTAYRMMYASSRLNACWSKLFKKSIIDEFAIEFEKGVAVGEDAAFVTEYFSKCNSYHFYNTEKILYYRQHNASAMKHYEIGDRLGFTERLYNISYDKLADNNDKELLDEVAIYYLRVLTNLYREYAQREAASKLTKTYKELLANEWANKVIDKVSDLKLPVLKKLEYIMIKNEAVTLLKIYFKVKARKA